MKIQFCQLNFNVADLEYNFSLIRKAYIEAAELEVDLVVFSELALSGYAVQDLWLNPHYILTLQEYFDRLVMLTAEYDTAMMIGHARQDGSELYNSIFLIHKNKILDYYDKLFLAEEGVFHENRYFSIGKEIKVFYLNSLTILPLICEDLWHYEEYISNWEKSNIEENIDLIISIHASVYEKEKQKVRESHARCFTEYFSSDLFYLNLIGGQDNLIFDGSSFRLEKDLTIINYQKFQEYNILVEYNKKKNQDIGNLNFSENYTDYDQYKDIYNALILSLRDYLKKNKFKTVLLGFSAGIDSSLTAQLAIDAIGAENVFLFGLSTIYNSEETFQDASDFLRSAGVKHYQNIDMNHLYNSFRNSVKNDVLNTEELLPITDQNIQARIRGLLLMSVSNNEGHLLLSTSNKSELAVGYGTLYGDMCGGFAPIKDLYKTEVIALSKWRNSNYCTHFKGTQGAVISNNIILKNPSAELAFNQKDQDSLPDYQIMDQILEAILENKSSISDLISLGFESDIVLNVLSLVEKSEYKRKQSVLGPKISRVSFSYEDRIYPTNYKLL